MHNQKIESSPGYIASYRKRRKFQGVKISWFFNFGSEVKFHGFRGSYSQVYSSQCESAVY